MTNDAPQPAIQALHKAFCNVAQAQVSLLRVNPRTAPKDLLALYERVGAGGTPLTAEERLFSIYKHHVPEIRKSVDTIHEEAGRVLSHVKIAAAGLRVANASKKHPSYSVPSVADFSRQMEDPYSELRQNLEHLIPPGAEKRSRFCESFFEDQAPTELFRRGRSILSSGRPSCWAPSWLVASSRLLGV
jgi:hypothetical protein